MIDHLSLHGVKAIEGNASIYTVPSENLLVVARLAATKNLNTVIVDATAPEIVVTFVARYVPPDIAAAKDAAFQCCF